MSYDLRLSAHAQHEIAQALAWTEAHFGKKQQNAYRKLIRRALSHLMKHPLKAPTRKRDDIGLTMRSLHIAQMGKPGRHFFIYRIVDHNIVEIARFLHDSMDISQLHE